MQPGPERRMYITVATDMALRTHLHTKGYGDEKSFRICRMDSPESIAHILECDITNEQFNTVSKSTKTSIFASACLESTELQSKVSKSKEGRETTNSLHSQHPQSGKNKFLVPTCFRDFRPKSWLSQHCLQCPFVWGEIFFGPPTCFWNFWAKSWLEPTFSTFFSRSKFGQKLVVSPPLLTVKL